MFYIYALAFIAAAGNDPVLEMQSKTSYESKAACEVGLKSPDMKKANDKLKAMITALGEKKKVKFTVKFECREETKEDDGSI